MDQVAEVVADIEEEKARGLVSGVSVFRSMLNQPAFVSVNSANATSVSSQNGFSTFTVNMPRPVLEVSTLQLLNAVIPLPTTNIPDTACVFWYYRLSAYSGLAPNTNNLYYNRLLPSYYKPENVDSSSNYGWNKTFTSYADCGTALALAGAKDLAWDNQTLIVGSLDVATDFTKYKVQYIPNDVAITYNSTYNKFQLTGSNVSTPFATNEWASSNTYALNDVVWSYNSNVNPAYATYQSVQAANSNHPPVDGSVPPALNSAWWKQIYTDLVYPYDTNTFYRKGSLAYILSPYFAVYQAQWDTHASGGALLTDPYTWDATRVYWINDFVSVSSVSYVCVSPNKAVNPTSGGATGYWLPYQWASGTTYALGQNIYYNPTGRIYQSLIPNNTAIPANTSPYNNNAWKVLGQFQWTAYVPTAQNPNYRYLATGFNDPNVVLNQGTGRRQWSPYALYENGNAVQFNDTTYTAVRQNRNFPPFIAGGSAWSATTTYSVGQLVSFTPQNSTITYFQCIQANKGQIPSPLSAFWNYQSWSATGTAPIVGLNAVSQALDMVEVYTTGGYTYVDAPFPEGIPAQPFNPVPRRILNSILGFTWNGQIPDPSVLQTIVIFDPAVYGTVALIGNTGVTLYNRLRPIPPYVVETGLLALGDDFGARPSTTSTTYTAEGYANLVYTSIVSIYSTIVCGSTVNTQRNTNLLATVGMNAGNLGVAYYQNYIDDALKLYQNDIYTISIELRDEMDEPYYLTNNAVCSFTMKLTYKE